MTIEIYIFIMFFILVSGILIGVSIMGIYLAKKEDKKSIEINKLKYILSTIGESFSNFGYQRDNFKIEDSEKISLNKKNVQIIKTSGIIFKEIYAADAIDTISIEDLKIVLDILNTSANGVDIDNRPIEVLANIYHNKRIKGE